MRAARIDLDGTLLDTAPDIAAAANPALVRRAISGTLEGDADEAAYQRGLPLFERYYTEESARRSVPYPGRARAWTACEGRARCRLPGLVRALWLERGCPAAPLAEAAEVLCRIAA